MRRYIKMSFLKGIFPAKGSTAQPRQVVVQGIDGQMIKEIQSIVKDEIQKTFKGELQALKDLYIESYNEIAEIVKSEVDNVKKVQTSIVIGKETLINSELLSKYMEIPLKELRSDTYRRSQKYQKLQMKDHEQGAGYRLAYDILKEATGYNVYEHTDKNWVQQVQDDGYLPHLAVVMTDLLQQVQHS